MQYNKMCNTYTVDLINNNINGCARGMCKQVVQGYKHISNTDGGE